MHNTKKVSDSFSFLVAVLIALLWNLSGIADAYPTGSMSCDDIGNFAEATVIGKQNGQTLEQALAKVTAAAADNPTERKVLAQIVRAVYIGPLSNLSESGAKMAFAADCEAQAHLKVETPRGTFTTAKASWIGDSLRVEVRTQLENGTELNAGISDESRGDNLISDVIHATVEGGKVVFNGYATDRNNEPLRPGHYWFSIAKGSDILPLAGVVPIIIPKRSK